MGRSERRMSRRSVTVKDVPADEFIKACAEFLKRQPKFDVPKYHDIVKTGVIKEFAPYDEDWFYVRSASILRKVYPQGSLCDRIRCHHPQGHARAREAGDDG